jgi:hypothetical protein
MLCKTNDRAGHSTKKTRRQSFREAGRNKLKKEQENMASFLGGTADVIRSMTGAEHSQFDMGASSREILQIRDNLSDNLRSKVQKKKGMHHGMVGEHKSHLITR